MSKVLSIYNDWAFYELVLPSAINSEYSFLLDAGLFHLSKNELLQFECVHGIWHFNMSHKISPISAKADDTAIVSLHGRFRYTTSDGEDLTILAEDKDSPLSVYSKHVLVPNRDITIGLDTDNTIRYRYPVEKTENSFVSRHHCILRYDGTNAYLEDHSSNGTYVNNIRVNGTMPLQFGDSVRIFALNIIYLGNILAVNAPPGMSSDLIEITPSERELLVAKGFKDGSSSKSLFYRAPRIVPRISTETVVIDPPPTPRETPNVPLFMQIGPAMTMTIPMLLGSGLSIVASRMSGAANPALMMTGIVTALASAVIGTFWAIINMRFNKKQIVQGEERRYDKYGRYLIDKQDQIEELYHINSSAFRERYVSADVIADYNEANEKLWSRNFNHSDVLTYRLGTGIIPFPAKIEIPNLKFSMIDDALAEKPQVIKDRFSTMRDVPVCVDLKDKSLIGIIGETNSWAQVIKTLIVQIAGNNSYTDVKIAFVYDAANTPNAKGWDFVRWLPHTWSEDKSIRFYATNKNEAGEVFYSLGQTMRARSEDEKSTRKPYYILFVLNKELLEGELLAKYISDTSDAIGLSTVIATERYESLPNNCEFIIENNRDFSGIYSTIDEHAEQLPIEFDYISDEKLLAFAKRLANIEVDEVENGGEIPASISFFEMHGISRPGDLNASERWRKAKTAETMKALIGAKNGQAPCYLDIHERYHGPHGLVAGTTGSGKSETLQTYMLSLAINYSPDDIGFFIIDYKGGGMANLFEGLPHIIGAISNLSGNQVKRAMVSIKSENKRRQRLFSDHGVNNINAYTSLYKNGDAKEPIPHMFIIIDEFAELKREEPDFMRELVSVAQVGRSLGVHLILATQKPAGTVDDNIWSNSKFRLCLRVQDRQDSMDMLHRPDAAYLTQAGRGFLQVGNDELFELFQSGYSGATYDESVGDRKLTVAQMLDPIGKVDLAGNHFKIQYQETVLNQWIAALYKAVCQTIDKFSEDHRADDALLFDDAFLNGIYDHIADQGKDYKRSQYNDVRLRDFVKLVDSIKDFKGEDPVEVIRTAASKQGVKLPEIKSKTQLEAVKEYLAQVAQMEGYTRQISLWMPLLPVSMLLTDIEGYREYELRDRASEAQGSQWTLSAVIGKGDDPENQSQMPISIDFANNGHHAVCGTISTGKSTFLQTAIFSLVSRYSSDELNLYIIDFSAKLLGVFSECDHVGGIMTDAEEDQEKISKFFTLMTSIVNERKNLLAGSNFRDYVEHSGKTLPAIVIVIDNYASFTDKTDERYDDILRQLAKDGISYGIFLLFTAAGFGTSEIPTRMADNFRTTLCLEMSDIYQYSDVMRVVKVPVMPESNVKGRGLVYYGDRIIEFQTALACEGESAFERNETIRKRIEVINQYNKGKPARRIPIIPEKPSWDGYVLQEDYTNLINSPALLPNGYDAETASYSSLDLTSLLTYVVSGSKKSGKSTYMKTLIRSCMDKQSEVCIIEIGSSEFQQIAADTGCRYITTGQEIFDFAKNVLLVEAGKRAQQKTEGLNKRLDDEDFFEIMRPYQRYCVFIPNTEEFLKKLYNRESEAYQALSVYETLVGEKGYHYNFYFFVEVDDAQVADVLGYKFMQSFKDNGRGIRFGGRYLSQKLFTYANVPYKIQGNPLKAGIGVVPCDDETARMEQIVVPNYKG